MDFATVPRFTRQDCALKILPCATRGGGGRPQGGRRGRTAPPDYAPKDKFLSDAAPAQGYASLMRSSSKTHAHAKALRRSLTPPETALWALLRTRGAGGPTFRRQHPIGPFIADFCCAAARLVVEIDGWDHATPTRGLRDAQRDRYMADLGYTVIRIAAAEVMASAGDVAQSLHDTALGQIAEAKAARAAGSQAG